MARETLDYLKPQPGEVFVDATLGFGGHATAIASELGPSGVLIGIDQDDFALAEATARLEELPAEKRPTLLTLHGNFADLDALLLEAVVPGIDGILFDLGVSSHQIDEPTRGFSFRESGPLDMRMNPGKQTLTAQEILNHYTAADLTRIIRTYGEERWASRIAEFVVKARAKAPITTTDELVALIDEAIPAGARQGGRHPARKTFQALRIAVNDELEALRQGLEAAIRWLNVGGRIAAISYHSLEDRIVKATLASLEHRCTCPPDLPVCVCGRRPMIEGLTKKPVVPGPAEIEANPRSRSAKLRAARKLDATAA